MFPLCMWPEGDCWRNDESGETSSSKQSGDFGKSLGIVCKVNNILDDRTCYSKKQVSYEASSSESDEVRCIGLPGTKTIKWCDMIVVSI